MALDFESSFSYVHLVGLGVLNMTLFVNHFLSVHFGKYQLDLIFNLHVSLDHQVAQEEA